MKDYSGYEDWELLAEIKAGNDEAMDFLMEKYRNHVKKESRKFFLVGADEEDLLQEGMIGLFKAIQGYDGEKTTAFSTFATLCIRRQLYTTITASNRKKHGPLNHYISFFDQDGYQGEQLFEASGAALAENPENTILRKEMMLHYYDEMEKKLSHFEKQVIRLYLNGDNYAEIAACLGKTSKSVDNAIQRIRKKLG